MPAKNFAKIDRIVFEIYCLQEMIKAQTDSKKTRPNTWSAAALRVHSVWK